MSDISIFGYFNDLFIRPIKCCQAGPINHIRVLASQNDGKKQMALKCTKMIFFSCFIIQIGTSTSIFFFPEVDLIEKPKFGDQKLSSLKSSKKTCLTK